MLLIPAAAQAAPKTHPVVVRVLASGGWKALPVVGAKLSVRQGGKLVARGRSGSRGMTILRARRGQGALRVTARGGKVGGRHFAGTMSAEVRRYSWPETIHVDSVTTLANRYHGAHPNLSASKARSRTKRFLELPAGYVFGRDGTSDASTAAASSRPPARGAATTASSAAWCGGSARRRHTARSPSSLPSHRTSAVAPGRSRWPKTAPSSSR